MQQAQEAVAPPDFFSLALRLVKVSGMLQERERLAKAAKAAEGSSEEGRQAEAPAGLRHKLHDSTCSVCLSQITCDMGAWLAFEQGNSSSCPVPMRCPAYFSTRDQSRSAPSPASACRREEAGGASVCRRPGAGAEEGAV